MEGKTSLRWCVYDHDGRFVVAGISWKYGNCCIVEGEDVALPDVIFETDFKSVVDVIHR
jgi:hypothetical protein